MTWAELRNLDLLALPWRDAIRWGRRWQVAALLVVWGALWAICWYTVFEPRQQALVAQSQRAALRSQQLAQAQFAQRQRVDLSKAISAHMSQTRSKPLREDQLLKRLNREGIFSMRGGKAHCNSTGTGPQWVRAWLICRHMCIGLRCPCSLCRLVTYRSS